MRKFPTAMLPHHRKTNCNNLQQIHTLILQVGQPYLQAVRYNQYKQLLPT